MSGGLDEQYELEAMDPPELRLMIDDALAETWSAPAHAAVLAREREERDRLVATSPGRWAPTEPQGAGSHGLPRRQSRHA